MEINADLVGRHVLKMAAEIEALVIQRDMLAEENDKLRQEIAAKDAPKGPVAVPQPVEVDGA